MTSLQLNHYFYPNISIKAHPKNKPSGDEKTQIDVKREFRCIDKEERDWSVHLTLKTVKQGALAPYRIEIDVVGFFKVNKEYPTDEVEKLVQIGGASILYSATREFILMLTSRGPWGPVFLPSITFKPEETEKPPETEETEPRKESATVLNS